MAFNFFRTPLENYLKLQFVEHPDGDPEPKEKRAKNSKESSRRSASPPTATEQTESKPVAMVKVPSEPVTTTRVHDVMAAAKRAIEERKKQMNVCLVGLFYSLAVNFWLYDAMMIIRCSLPYIVFVAVIADVMGWSPKEN